MAEREIVITELRPNLRSISVAKRLILSTAIIEPHISFAITFNSTAIGVGRALIATVVRVA